MKKIFFLFTILVLVIVSCKSRQEHSVYFLSPEEGSAVRKGTKIVMRLDASGNTFDSVHYLIDTTLVESRKDTGAVAIPTSNMSLGIKVLTARVYNGRDYKEVTTNIVLLPSKAPVDYAYKVVHTFPHDTSAFTEGLEYHDGYLYESTGRKGYSSLRKVDLHTGKVLQKTDLADRYFGEGITLVGDKIVQLTYQEGVGFVYDRHTFKKLAEFPYQAGREGWGLYFDGKYLLNSDGSNTIYLLDKTTYQKAASFEVYDNQGPVDDLNELEMVDGKLFANVWQKDLVVIINPATGEVEGRIDFTNLYPLDRRNANANEFNGIAWDPVGRRLFVTGKNWDKLFEVRIFKK